MPVLVLVVTTSLTGTVCGLFEAPPEVIVIVPLYVPAASPVGFAVTCTVVGVEAVIGLMVSQVPRSLKL